jgi:hypothetical protein
MKNLDEIQWKYFLDKSGNRVNEVILNGGEVSPHFKDYYFELEIDNNQLYIGLEDEDNFFYKKKLDTIYPLVYETVYRMNEKKEYAFYNEYGYKYARIVERVYSTLENENY